MKQKLGYFPLEITPPELSKIKELTLSTSEKSVSEWIIDMLGAIVSTPSFVKMLEPINVEGDKITIKNHLMIDEKPYAIRYKNKDYIIIKEGTKTKLFELNK